MNLTKLYRKFTEEQKVIISHAWDCRFSVALTPALFPFADLKAVILALELLVADLPADDTWFAKVRKLIDQLMEYWRTGEAKDFHTPKYRKLEKKRKKRK